MFFFVEGGLGQGEQLGGHESFAGGKGLAPGVAIRSGP